MQTSTCGNKWMFEIDKRKLVGRHDEACAESVFDVNQFSKVLLQPKYHVFLEGVHKHSTSSLDLNSFQYYSPGIYHIKFQALYPILDIEL